MPRLWYPERFHVEVICHRLAERLFTYEPLPAFQFDGGEHGAGLLDSALALPRQSFGGRYFYPAWYDKAGVLLRSIVKNHALKDGNKRVGLATTLVFLMMNGRFLFVSNEEMVNYALSIAAKHGSPPWRRIARWVRQKTLRFAAVPGITERLIKLYPDRADELNRTRRALAYFEAWSHTYRQIENDLRRQCIKEGIDPNLALREFAERVAEESL